MKTVGEIIERADSIRANPFTVSQKAEWVANLDSKICAEFLHGKYPTEGYYRQQGSLLPEDIVPGASKLGNVTELWPEIHMTYTDLTICFAETTPWIPHKYDIIRLSGLTQMSGETTFYDPSVLNKKWTIKEVRQGVDNSDIEHTPVVIRLEGGYSIAVPAGEYFRSYELSTNPDMALWLYPKPGNVLWTIAVPEPWDEIYVVHLLSQIDFYQGEMTRHNAMLARFEDLLEEYTAYLAREGQFDPKTVETVPKIIY